MTAKQTTLLASTTDSRLPAVAEVAPVEQLPAVQPSYEHKPGTALADIREQAMSVPVDVMRDGLAEYKEQRDTFREWLLRQLIEGVHFGFPPGCQPVWDDRPDGRYYKSGKNWNHESVWRPKPSLYEAGANFICDLMGWRDECDADMQTWEQLGKPSGSMVRKCNLYARTTNKFIATGTGARVNGDKYMDLNASIKMADKSARVAAVKNALGLSDLFTQDEPGAPRPPNEAPDQRADAPKVAPRGASSSASSSAGGITQAQYDQMRGECGDIDDQAFRAWVFKTLNDGIFNWNPCKPQQWTASRLTICLKALGVPTE